MTYVYIPNFPQLYLHVSTVNHDFENKIFPTSSYFTELLPGANPLLLHRNIVRRLISLLLTQASQ